MAQQFCLDLKQVFNDQQAQQAAQILIQSLVEGNVLKKQVGKDFFAKCLRNLQDDRATPQLKFYTLSIFRFIDLKNKNALKVFSILTGQPIFTYIIQTARNTDPRKSIAQKGKSLFPQNKELGNKFMRLLLQSIKLWNERFPQNNQKQPTKYRKSYLKLVQEKVTFPDTYIFYGEGSSKVQKQQKQTPGNPNRLSQAPREKQKKQQKRQQKVQSPTPNQPGNTGGSDEQVTKGSIMLLWNKIQNFIDFIQDADSVDQLEREVKKNHKMYEKQQKKLESGNLAIDDQKMMNMYLKINEFLIFEIRTYEQEITKRGDLKTYCDSILMEYDKTFAQEIAAQGRPSSIKPKAQSPSKQKEQKPKNKVQETKQKYSSQNVNNSTTSNKQNSKVEQKKKYESVNSNAEKQKNSKKKDEDEQQREVMRKIREKNQNVESNQIKDKGLKGFFQSHLQKSQIKSKSGFKAIKQSLEKQKKQLKVNPVRGKSPMNSMSRTKFNASTVSKIKASGIFGNPPNANIPPKKYEGALVLPNPQIQSVLVDMERQQGMKRLKTANLKSRALLYQSQYIQIGYKSEPLYDQVVQFEQIMKFQLFIGNKSSQQIRNLNIIFQGDQKSLVYSDPQKAPQSIAPGDQFLITVLIIPRSQPYTMTRMYLSYKMNSQPVQGSCLLPSSILKFSHYDRVDSRQAIAYEKSTSRCYQTEKFLLSHYFPPRKIAHYIEELSEITEYSEFAQTGSQKDFVLAAFVTIKDKVDGLLKINIRPNLDVILQIYAKEDTEESEKEFKIYLQTLQLVLKEAR